jgi:hypothetical protein
VRLSPLRTATTVWPIVPAPDGRWWVCSSRWNANWQGKPKYSDKTCLSATSSITNLTWPDPGSVGSRRLTAWAMAWSYLKITVLKYWECHILLLIYVVRFSNLLYWQICIYVGNNILKNRMIKESIFSFTCAPLVFSPIGRKTNLVTALLEIQCRSHVMALTSVCKNSVVS